MVENSQNEEKLAELLLIIQRVIQTPIKTAFVGFDWFLATLFLVCGGDLER